MPDVISQLELLLKRRGWSQTYLAERAGLPVSSVQKYAQHGVVPGLVPAVKIARALGVDVTDVWKIDGIQSLKEDRLIRAIAVAMADGVDRISRDIREALHHHDLPDEAATQVTQRARVAAESQAGGSGRSSNRKAAGAE